MIISDLNYIQTVNTKEVEGGFLFPARPTASTADSSQIVVVGVGSNFAKTNATSTFFVNKSSAKAGSFGAGLIVAQHASATSQSGGF